MAGLTGAVSAGMGGAATVGGLSVPAAWAASAPTLSHAAVAALPGAVSSGASSLGSGAAPVCSAGCRWLAHPNGQPRPATPRRTASSRFGCCRS
ncbi:polymorphic PE/PPE s C terminal family protein [Mycobacterium kansasii]|uniref:Polymorphic PE/PPE s C terminal family protein n=1 Tax=Mycobacterium kansasii TaxID=1768 RepID=A0A1V3WTT0_MYCKA|nr:polymorphic PE/PPE s C terminal family protein [Mycobacterium kansasii]